MTDRELLKLYTQRDERAIAETDAKYGKRCRQIAQTLLGSAEDAEEIVNDVWMQAWAQLAQTQNHPQKLGAFLAGVTRNLSTNRLDRYTAQRRAGDRAPAVLEELADCLAAPESVEQTLDRRMLAAEIRRFLETLPEEQRAVFLLRYHYVMSVKGIAALRGIGESKVKVMLLRTRQKLRRHLEQEDLL